MSQPIAETYVTIRPELAANFESDLKRQIQADVDKATAGLKAKVGDDRFARLQKAGVVASFQSNAALIAEREHTERFAASQRDAAAASGGLSQTVSGSIIKFGLYGAAITGLYRVSQQLRAGLVVTGAEAATTEGRFRNLGAALLSGDVIGAFKALRTEVSLSTADLETLQETLAKGDQTLATQIAKAAEVFGSDKLRAQLSAASFQTRANVQSDRATAASLTPGLRDDLAAAKVAEREAQIGLRIFKQGTSEYSKAFQGYAAAVKERRQVQDQIEKTSSPLARDAARDAQFQLNLARAQQTKGTGNDKALLEGRRDYLRRQIAILESEGATTTAAKTRLTGLYGQLSATSGEITELQKQSLADRQAKLQEQISLQQTELQIQEANARNDSQEIAALRAQQGLATKLSSDKRLDAQARAGYALHAAQLDKQVFQINTAAAAAAKAAAEAAAAQREQERKEALAKLKAKIEERKQLGELRLSNAEAASGLTKRTSDDKKAIQRSIAYYKGIVKNTQGLEREQARSALISARSRLQGLKSGNEQQGATTAEFFAKAAQQFGEFGSNIADRGGVLSGQDARGQFASLALQGGLAGKIAAALDKTTKPQLTEAQKQTALLERIAAGVGVRDFRTPDQRDRFTIANARNKATFIGGV